MKKIYLKVYGGKIQIVLVTLLIVVGLLQFGAVSLISGNVGIIHEVNMEDSEGLRVTAYYKVKYYALSDYTITVFVKNETNDELSSATIKEINTGAETTISNINPNE